MPVTHPHGKVKYSKSRNIIANNRLTSSHFQLTNKYLLSSPHKVVRCERVQRLRSIASTAKPIEAGTRVTPKEIGMHPIRCIVVNEQPQSFLKSFAIRHSQIVGPSNTRDPKRLPS
jgi:hypothetical protein